MFLTGVATLGVAGAADAGVVLQPAAASTDMATADGHDIGNLRDQSGLRLTYDAGVSDLDAYVAASPKHNSFPKENTWASPELTGNVDFDLGGSVTITTMAYWAIGEVAQCNANTFNLFADDNADFTSPTLLGSYVVQNTRADTQLVPVETFSFEPTLATHVRMQITSSEVNGAGIGEVAFESVAPVPEPAAALGGLSLLGLAVLRRR